MEEENGKTKEVPTGKRKNDKTKHLGKEGQPEDKVEKVRGEQSRKSPADADTGDERTENAALSEGLGGPGPPRVQRGAAGPTALRAETRSPGRRSGKRPPPAGSQAGLPRGVRAGRGRRGRGRGCGPGAAAGTERAAASTL